MAVNMAGVHVGECDVLGVGKMLTNKVATTPQCFYGLPSLHLWILLGFSSLHVLSFKKKVFPVTCFGCLSGERRVWTVVYM